MASYGGSFASDLFFPGVFHVICFPSEVARRSMILQRTRRLDVRFCAAQGAVGTVWFLLSGVSEAWSASSCGVPAVSC